MAKYSVIIPCFHNGLDKVALSSKAIRSVNDTVKDVEIIIVENLTRWMVDESDIYIFSKEPKSYAENINMGMAASSGSYICCLNNDLILPRNWTDAIEECFKIPDCGVATIDSTQYNREPSDEIIEHFFGGFWVIKRQVYEEVGFMDSGFRHAFDDADYWVRVYKQGYKIYMNRKVVADHKGGSTIYGFKDHSERFVAMRSRFNLKHKDCELPIFQKLR
jgi:GT2 family glycosyltransferase